MTFWITKSEEHSMYGIADMYVLHYGHSETSVAVIASKQSLSELKELLGSMGF